MVYDAASNLTQKITANLAAKNQAIQYDYDFNRLKTITYPSFHENNVAYQYGPPGAPNNAAGRITVVSDESGKEERFYGKLGEIVKETKTVASDTQGKSDNSPEIWTTSYLYDTWGRLQQMQYPDGELLTYKYDSGGLPKEVMGKKQSSEYPYVQKLEYDKFEQRAFMLQGNGVETTFDYDPADRRLQQLQAGDFQDLKYTYDNVGNITALKNDIPPGQTNPQDFGGPVDQSFGYDGLYRLTSASGEWRYAPSKKDQYSLTMAYDSIHNITQKLQGHQKVTPGGAEVPFKKTSYANSYAYTSGHPHAPTKIGDFAYSYDKNGNQTGWDDLTSGQKRVIVWDEENRIQEIHDNGRTSHYKYNDAGERVIKRTEQGETAYVNQFWTIRNKSVGTKHVFVGETRIASKVVPGSANVDPGDLFGTTLGPWAKQPGNGKKTIQNPHYAGNKMPANLAEDNFVFFYHPDHLGSTEYVTDASGELYEHVQYFPFGETWVSEHKNTEKLPYLFTGKELDEETGLYYIGARYFDPRASVWQSADPMLPIFLSNTRAPSVYFPPNLALYSYCWNGPLVYRDPNGGEPDGPGAHESLKRCQAQGGCTREDLEDIRQENAAGAEGSGYAVDTIMLIEGGESLLRHAPKILKALPRVLKESPRLIKSAKGAATRLLGGARKLAGKVIGKGPDIARFVDDVFSGGSKVGRELFGRARAMLARSSLSPAQKADAFEKIASRINRVDPSWMARRGPATNATAVFTGDSRPFGFAIDASGRVWQTSNVAEGAKWGPKGWTVDYSKWTLIE